MHALTRRSCTRTEICRRVRGLACVPSLPTKHSLYNLVAINIPSLNICASILAQVFIISPPREERKKGLDCKTQKREKVRSIAVQDEGRDKGIYVHARFTSPYASTRYKGGWVDTVLAALCAIYYECIRVWGGVYVCRGIWLAMVKREGSKLGKI